jgi:hypothetical protein
LTLQGLIFFPIGGYSDSDASLESECETNQESPHASDCDTEECPENLELGLGEMNDDDDEYRKAPWNPNAQLRAHFNTAQLAQLHADIKARATLLDPTYQKLQQLWASRSFDVRILLDQVQQPEL